MESGDGLDMWNVKMAVIGHTLYNDGSRWN